MARRLRSRPSVARVGDQPVFERVLGNGLKVLVLPRKGVQIVVCDLFYPVGSFDEPPGRSGIAHFLEHMLFKGTERFPKGRIDQLAFLAGGQANADTGEDRTHYWFSLPADQWELALEIEADRMVHARFDPREVEAERQVIGEERARDVESPLIRLDQTHQALSYLRHPYRDPVIGWPEDLAATRVEDLEAFYRRHYRPDGAVLVLTGDVEPVAALDRAAAHFGAIPPGASGRPPRRPGVEAPQAGRRDFVMDDPDALPRGILGWHTVPEDHPDSPALEVLADVLSAGRRSRLWRSLVDEDRLVGWVEAAHACGRQAGQFFIQLEAAEDQIDPTEVEEAVADVIADLAEFGPAPEELARVRNRFEAGWRWDQEDLLALACGVGQAALWGDWRDWQAEHAAALAVDAAAVRRVASRYLVESNLTAGWLLRPEDARPGAAPPAPRRRALVKPITIVATTATVGLIDIGGPAKPTTRRPRLLDYRPRRFALENGLRVIYERRPGVGVAAVELYVEGGWVREAVPGVSALTSRMLEEGSVGRSAQELAAAIEDVGGSLELSSTWSSLRTRSEDLGLGLELLADVVRRPLFPPEALGWARQRIVGELRGDREDPAFRADQAFRAMVYGDHPLGRDPRGGVREIGRLTREDVIAHHRRCFAPEAAFLVVVGEFDPRRLRRMIEKRFGDWAPSGEAVPSWPALPEQGRPRSRRIDHPGEQVHIVLGHRGIARRHPDFDALLVLDHILGSGPGFSDRLGRIVRDELGLVYTVGGGMTDSADLTPGLFRIYAGTMPEEADRVVAAIVDQIRAMHRGAFSDEEVAGVRQYLAGAALFDLQTVEQRAERLVELERLGLPLDEPKTWPDRIAAITPRQVRDAARIHLHPDALFRVALGPLSRKRRSHGGGRHYSR